MDEPAQSDEPIDGPDTGGMTVLCPHCLLANSELDHFCRNCTTPLTSHAAVDPLGRVFAEGDTMRKAVAHPSNPVVLIGMWLIFAPTVFTSVGLLMDAGSIGSIPGAFLVIVLAMYAGLGVLSCAILVRVTRNFVRERSASAGQFGPRGFDVIAGEDEERPKGSMD